MITPLTKPQPLRVLMVEDDKIDQMAFRRMVDQMGLPYDCQLADSLREANDALAVRRFDIILSDYQLGDGTGLDVIEAAADTPVILVTGAGAEEIAVEAMKAGAYDYLVKDHDRKYLILLPVQIENAIRRHRAEQESQQLLSERIRREVLEQFITSASHDLRTPLSALSTSIYLLERYTDLLATLVRDPDARCEQVLEQVDRIRQRSIDLKVLEGHLERLILDMLEMLRIDSLDTLANTTVDLNQVVTDVVNGHLARARAARVHLTTTLATEPLLFVTSVTEFMTALSNLIANAIQYTPLDGSVTVETSGTEDTVRVTVRDTGIGISDDEIQHIFERFYRVDKSRSASEGSSGLGLSIVKRVMELNHGRIHVESAVGQGSAFTLEMPRVKV